MMADIKLITDSTSDLTDDLLKKHDIDVVPLYVNFSDESFFDGVNLTTEEMYGLVDEKNELPKTAAASPGMFEEAFKPYVEEGKDIIYLGIGSKFSASLQSAMAAKDILESDKIHVIDSGNLSSGSGLLLLKAAGFIEDGDPVGTVVEKIQALVPKVRSQFVIKTLEYLYKGGRLNALSHLMGTMLKIKPIIKVRDGVMVVGKKSRGSLRKGIDLMLREFLRHRDDIDKEFVTITHSLNREDATYIREKLEKQGITIEHLYETEAGCVISSHCGRGTIGILYMMK